MSKLELMEELAKLPAQDLLDVHQFITPLLDAHGEEGMPLSPELAAAVEDAKRSLREEGGIPIEEVMEWIKSWEPTK